MYGWSKHGGRNFGLVMEELNEWYCQVCQEKQTKDLPAYYIPVDEDEREFVRVCSKCKNIAEQNNICYLPDLLKLRHKPDGVKLIYYVENLPTCSYMM